MVLCIAFDSLLIACFDCLVFVLFGFDCVVYVGALGSLALNLLTSVGFVCCGFVADCFVLFG